MQKQINTLDDLLRLHSHQRFLFVKPGGNHGDFLIYLGMRSLAKHLCLEYKEILFTELEMEKLDDYDVVYVHGSGGFVPWWSGTPYKSLEYIASHFKKTVIIGPSTFHIDQSYILNLFEKILHNRICDNLYVYFREYCSYESLNNIISRFGDTYIDHDTAFHAHYFDILKSAKIMTTPKKRVKKIYALRCDRETEQNVYLKLKNFAVDPVQYTNTFKEWIFFHMIASSLITNRLHSAILGYLLDIDTTLLPNSYHKNRSVWEYSLKDKGIKWQNELTDTSKSNMSIQMQKWLQKKRSWQRCVGRFYYGSLSC